MCLVCNSGEASTLGVKQGERAVGEELREGGKGRSYRMSLTSTPNERETPDGF